MKQNKFKWAELHVSKAPRPKLIRRLMLYKQLFLCEGNEVWRMDLKDSKIVWRLYQHMLESSGH